MVSRDKMKILEFGAEEINPPPRRSDEGAGMKIVEFEAEAESGQKVVATANEIGHIKIVEFDDEPPKKTAPAADKPSRSVGAVKIKEFDEEGETREAGKVGSKMKILEFD